MSTFVEAVNERTAPLRSPIPGDAPSGVDISFDPDFERLKGEMDKLTGLDGAQPNWRDIIEIGEKLLSSKSKDLRVATWITVAKMNQGGWGGFAEGVAVFHSMVKDHWDTMFPEVKRARGRANLYTWLADQVAPFFEPKDVSISDGDAVRACDQLLTELDTMLTEKLGDLYPGPSKFRGLMRDKVRAIPEPTPEVSAEAPTNGGGGPASAASYSASSSSASAVHAPTVSSAADVDDAVRACCDSLCVAAEVLRKSDPAASLSYRLQRVGAWLRVGGPPPAEGTSTRIPSPGAELPRKFQQLVASESWMQLLHAAEEVTSIYLFWLDPHRYVALAMDRLGALFLGAREAVGREVTSFVSRYPAVPTLTFSDGTPFADAATQSWLTEDGKKYGGGGGGGSAGSAAANAEDEEVQKRLQEAKEMVSGGKVAEGLGLAVALANRAADARMRFRNHLLVARLALEGGKAEVARPMLEALLTQVETHGLEVWEPMLCSTLYSLLLSSHRAVSAGEKTPDLLAKEAFLFDKLCRLDPQAALKLVGG